MMHIILSMRGGSCAAAETIGRSGPADRDWISFSNIRLSTREISEEGSILVFTSIDDGIHAHKLGLECLLDLCP